MIERGCQNLLQERTEERCEGYLYKLSQAPAPYGMAVPLPDQLEIDEKAMCLWIPIADGNRRDGVGDLLEVEGIRTERHRKNPIVLFDHGKTVTLPIAMAEEPNSLAYTFRIDPVSRTAGVKAYFYQGKGSVQNPGYENRSSKVTLSKSEEYDHALFCEQLFDLTCKRFVRSGSIGYTVITAKNLQPDYERGSPAGLHLQSIWMLEGSLVVLPANMDTVRKMMCMPSVCGKPVSPYLIKSLQPYAGEKKVQMGYEGKAKPSDDISPDKAREILRDGIVHGKPLTDKQRRMFGAAANKGTKVPLRNLPDTKIPPSKWKPGVGAVKDLKAIRLKYRPSKGLRHRARKSKAGTSILHVDAKNVNAARELAAKKGLKFTLMGTHRSGAEAVKLMGADDAIDEVAKAFGRPMSRNVRVKGMPMPDDNAPTPDPNEGPVDTPEEVDATVEKWGAQMSRHFHSLHGAMLQDLDEMIAALENERAAAHFTKLAENIDKFMTETEQLFDKEYGGGSENNYPPLEGAEAKDAGDAKPDDVEEDLSEDNDPELEQEGDSPEMEDQQGDADTSDDAGVAADSAKPDPPTPEEAVEGMDKADRDGKNKDKGGTKALPAQKTKDIRIKYRQKANDPPPNDAQQDGGKKEGKREVTCAHCNKPIKKDVKRVGGKPYHPGCASFADQSKKSICPECGKEGCSCSVKAVEPGEDYGAEHIEGEAPGNEENADKPGEDLTGEHTGGANPGDEEHSKGIDARDMPTVTGAHGFLNEIAQPNSIFGEEHRMMSFHYHKALEGIGQIRAQAAKAMDDSMTDVPQPEEHPHFKMCKAAGGYFLRMSREKAFGDIHREEAKYHGAQLGQIVGGTAKQEEPPPAGEGDVDTPPEPPDMGDFSEDTMKSMVDAQNKQIEELSKALASLSGAI